MESSAERSAFLDEFASAFGSHDEASKAIGLVLGTASAKGFSAEKELDNNVSIARTVLRLGLDKNAVIAALFGNLLDAIIDEASAQKALGAKVIEFARARERFEKALLLNPEQTESLTKKMLIVLTTNPDVVMLQLAEMLEKMRKIEQAPQKNRDSLLAQIKEVYAPLSHKFGVYSISSEMNDLAFRHEHPKTYFEVERAMKLIASQTTSEVGRTKKEIEQALENAGIKSSVSGRAKTVYSTYAKMKRKKVGIRQIYDMVALRVMTESIKDCYEALGIFHSIWKPVPGEFDDYIAKPKENGYQSLHTSVYTHEGVPVEIQIRTKEMDDFAELGIASHWRYKGEKKDTQYDKKIEWIKQVLEWERSSGKNTDADIFGKEIFAMTPKGQVIELPEGASVIDFAYAVHSDIGDKCSGAKVNGNMVSLNTHIKNGDVVEIVTSQKQSPKMHWLTFAKTGKAKQKIMAKLNIQKGRESTKSFGGVGSAVKTLGNKVRLAKCCSPLPGDGVIGLRTTKRKISVHRSDCPQAKKLTGEKVPVEWGHRSEYYDIELLVKAGDRLGTFKEILKVLSQNKVVVSYTNANASASNMTTCAFGLRLKNLEQLEKIKKQISGIKGVTEVYRK